MDIAPRALLQKLLTVGALPSLSEQSAASLPIDSKVVGFTLSQERTATLAHFFEDTVFRVSSTSRAIASRTLTPERA